MPLARAAREILALDEHEVYRLAREGQIPGAFRIGKLWFVSVVTMIRGMQEPKAKPAKAVSSSTPRGRLAVVPAVDEEPDPDDEIWSSL